MERKTIIISQHTAAHGVQETLTFRPARGARSESHMFNHKAPLVGRTQPACRRYTKPVHCLPRLHRAIRKMVMSPSLILNADYCIHTPTAVGV